MATFVCCSDYDVRFVSFDPRRALAFFAADLT